MSILITGVSGVGKSFIGNVMCETLKYDIINMGHLMLESCSQNLSIDEQRTIACKIIGSRPNNSNLIIDIHSVLNISNEIILSIVNNDIIDMKVTKIIIIEASPSTIVERRQKDRILRPDRLEDSIQFIERIQQCQRSVISELSTQTNIPFTRINNDNTKLEKVITLIKKFIKA